jgi:hypothetical protein
MKARPRSVENRVAEALSEKFSRLGLPAVERIPVLGRTGPDITINGLKLIVDVKSRIEVPKSLFFPLEIPFAFDPLARLIGVRVCCLPTLWDGEWPPAPLDVSSKIVRGYIEHMEEWTREHEPDGVSCIVLHRPEIPIGNSVVVIYSSSRRRLIEYARKQSNNPIPAK